MGTMLVAPVQELMEDEGDLVRMGCAPGNNALEFDGVIGDGADLNQIGFDSLWITHFDLYDVTHPPLASYGPRPKHPPMLFAQLGTTVHSNSGSKDGEQKGRLGLGCLQYIFGRGKDDIDGRKAVGR